MHQTSQRIDRLERLVADLDGRVAVLERPAPAARTERPEPVEPVTQEMARAALAERAAIGRPATERATSGPDRAAPARPASVTARPAPARYAPAPARHAPAPARPAPAASAPPAAPSRPARPSAPRAAAPPPATIFGLDFGREDLEDLVGGRVLAWVGGLAVLLGIVFLFALAISNGWIGETARVLFGAAGSAGLLALGVWLHERKARTDAALASVATGISGLFITITVAAQVYELLPQLIAVVFAVGVGAVATALALRWESRGIAVLGILGALAAPVLSGVAGDGGTMLILFVALASAGGVLLWQRWDWLALAAFAVATPQWIAYLVDGPPVLSQLAVLVGFGSLGVAVAIGHDVRVHAEQLRSSS